MTVIVGEMPFVVRFQNGASMNVPAPSIHEAAAVAPKLLLSCMPPGTDPKNVVRAVMVQLSANVCVICGSIFKPGESLKVYPKTGAGASLCMSCATVVYRTYGRKGNAVEQGSSEDRLSAQDDGPG